jgi:hypothetical protein
MLSLQNGKILSRNSVKYACLARTLGCILRGSSPGTSCVPLLPLLQSRGAPEPLPASELFTRLQCSDVDRWLSGCGRGQDRPSDAAVIFMPELRTVGSPAHRQTRVSFDRGRLNLAWLHHGGGDLRRRKSEAALRESHAAIFAKCTN